jgi:hypothetical protein
MAPNTYKQNGKLKSTLELGLGVFPYAETLQRALSAGMIRACSIGFDPLRWQYNKSRDGIDFHEISLREISAVTVPCCAGAVLDGPVKALPEAVARRQRTLDLIRGGVPGRVSDAVVLLQMVGSSISLGSRNE